LSGEQDHDYADTTTTEMAVDQYRKRLMQAWTIGLFMGGILVLVGFVTDWYLQILFGFGRLLVAQWWLGPSIALLVGLVIYLNRPRKKKQNGGA